MGTCLKGHSKFCSICHAAIAITGSGALDRYLLTSHNKYQTDYPPHSKLRKHFGRDLKTQLTTHSTASFEVNFLFGGCLYKKFYAYQSISKQL